MKNLHKMLRVYFLFFGVALLPLSLIASLPLPEGFELVEEKIGRGKYSHVHLVREISSGKLFVLKVRRHKEGEDGKNNRRIFRKTFILHTGWSLLGLTDTKMSIDRERYTLLQDYVDGPTLVQANQSRGNRFTASRNDPRTAELTKVIRILVSNRLILRDLNSTNIIWDGQRWQVIDSQQFELEETYEKTFSRYKRYMNTRKWAGGYGMDAETVKKFFDRFEKDVLPEIVAEQPARLPGVEEYVLAQEAAGKKNYRSLSWLVKFQPAGRRCEVAVGL